MALGRAWPVAGWPAYSGEHPAKVITEKIAHLSASGGHEARHIAAITFTNKAAREMRERISKRSHSAGTVRQWVLPLPKRLRPALRRHAALAARVFHIVIGSIERDLPGSVAAPVGVRIGSALNEHRHYHCCVSDALFAQASDVRLAFAPVDLDSESVIAVVQARVRRRVSEAHRRRCSLDFEAAEATAGWDHDGNFSGEQGSGLVLTHLRLWFSFTRCPARCESSSMVPSIM